MAEDAIPNTPDPAAAPPSAEAAVVATPESDPTPAQVESKTVVSKLSDDIDDLWKQVEKPSSERTPREPKTPTPTSGTAAPADATPATETVKADAPPPSVDQAKLDRQAEERVRARIAAEQEAERKATERVANEQRARQAQEAYIGTQSDYDAVNSALRAANLTGDYSQLDSLNVLLPNGKRVSEVKNGDMGLTLEEAAGVLNSWDQARAYEDVMGDRKVGRILDMWNAEVLSVLSDPDVDAAAVTTHNAPGQQMATLLASVRDRVTKRLTDAHTAELATRDKTISEQAQRIESLVNERGNLVSQRTAARSASPDRPGQPGGTRSDFPRTPEEIRAMSADEFFKSGASERLLQMLPGGASRRRTG